MTDDLAKRLRSMHWCVTTEANGVGVSDRKVALEAADRIEALIAELNEVRKEWEGWQSTAVKLMEKLTALTAERERLALAICGGEDAPGYANAQTVETLEHVAKQNQQSHGATINSLLAAQADNARLREALEACVASMEHADMSDGVCCCGEEIEGHSGTMDCGHIPVDMGEYHASLAIKEARAALTGKETK